MAGASMGHTDREEGVMTTTEQEAATDVVYDLEGTLLEACSCGVLCPCWVGSDPDGGTCDSFNAYHFDRGTIRGVDVGGLSFINVCHIPATSWCRAAGRS